MSGYASRSCGYEGSSSLNVTFSFLTNRRDKKLYHEVSPKSNYTYAYSGSYQPDLLQTSWRSPNLSRSPLHGPQSAPVIATPPASWSSTPKENALTEKAKGTIEARMTKTRTATYAARPLLTTRTTQATTKKTWTLLTTTLTTVAQFFIASAKKLVARIPLLLLWLLMALLLAWLLLAILFSYTGFLWPILCGNTTTSQASTASNTQSTTINSFDASSMYGCASCANFNDAIASAVAGVRAELAKQREDMKLEFRANLHRAESELQQTLLATALDRVAAVEKVAKTRIDETRQRLDYQIRQRNRKLAAFLRHTEFGHSQALARISERLGAVEKRALETNAAVSAVARQLKLVSSEEYQKTLTDNLRFEMRQLLDSETGKQNLTVDSLSRRLATVEGAYDMRQATQEAENARLIAAFADQLKAVEKSLATKCQQPCPAVQVAYSAPSAAVAVPGGPDSIPDFALHSAGAYVVGTRCTAAYSGQASVVELFGFPVLSFSRSPTTALEPNLHLGECWAFQSFPGHLIVRLAVPARISSVTLDHAAREVSYNSSCTSAPKNFTVYGLEGASTAFDEATPLGSFAYNAETGPPSQNFALNAITPRYYEYVELVVESNHGNPLYTCLYRFRVHGLA